MYENLVYATPGLKAEDIPKYFKDGSFGVPDGQAGGLVDRFQIRPEERALASRFERDFSAYKASLRRWVFQAQDP